MVTSRNANFEDTKRVDSGVRRESLSRDKLTNTVATTMAILYIYIYFFFNVSLEKDEQNHAISELNNGLCSRKTTIMYIY